MPAYADAFATLEQPIVRSAVILPQDHDLLAAVELHQVPGHWPQKCLVDDHAGKRILPLDKFTAQVNLLWTYRHLDGSPHP